MIKDGYSALSGLARMPCALPSALRRAITFRPFGALSGTFPQTLLATYDSLERFSETLVFAGGDRNDPGGHARARADAISFGAPGGAAGARDSTSQPRPAPACASLRSQA